MPHISFRYHFLAAILAAVASMQPFGARSAGAILSIEGFQSPESVLIVGERRFVSNIGAKLDPLGKDADGYISEVSSDGRIIQLHAFPPEGETLDAPKGMAELSGRLYVADIDRIVGFALASGNQVFSATVPGDRPTLLNDLTVTKDGDLLVSDTLRGAVYRVDVKTGSFERLAAGIPGANGIAAGNGHVYVAGLGADFGGGDLFELDGSGHALRLEGSPHGIFDGLAILSDGRLLVSDWVAIDHPVAGSFVYFGEEGAEEVNIGEEIHGPADFAYDAPNNTVWIPATLEGRVLALKLPE